MIGVSIMWFLTVLYWAVDWLVKYVLEMLYSMYKFDSDCICFSAQLSIFSYKLVKMLSVSVWILTRVEQIVTAAHRDL